MIVPIPENPTNKDSEYSITLSEQVPLHNTVHAVSLFPSSLFLALLGFVALREINRAGRTDFCAAIPALEAHARLYSSALLFRPAKCRFNRDRRVMQDTSCHKKITYFLKRREGEYAVVATHFRSVALCFHTDLDFGYCLSRLERCALNCRRPFEHISSNRIERQFLAGGNRSAQNRPAIFC